MPASPASAQAIVGWGGLLTAIYGPPLVGTLLDATGSFAAGFLTFAAITTAVLALTSLLRPFGAAVTERVAVNRAETDAPVEGGLASTPWLIVNRDGGASSPRQRRYAPKAAAAADPDSGRVAAGGAEGERREATQLGPPRVRSSSWSSRPPRAR